MITQHSNGCQNFNFIGLTKIWIEGEALALKEKNYYKNERYESIFLFKQVEKKMAKLVKKCIFFPFITCFIYGGKKNILVKKWRKKY